MALSHLEKPIGEEREEKKRRKKDENKGWMTQGFQWFVLLGVQQSMTPVQPLCSVIRSGAVQLHNFQFLSNLLIAGSQIAYQ